MTISTLAQYNAAFRQTIRVSKASPGSQSSLIWISTSMAGAGDPAAISSFGGTTNGAVPTSATTGALALLPFSGTGYISRIEYSCTAVGCRIMLYDRLFHAGTFSGASVAVNSLTAQPSYSSRVPGGNYSGLQIWLEQQSGGGGVNASNQMRVGYTDQSGNTGHVSGTVTKQQNAAGGFIPVALASGDCGVQVIENFEVVAQSSNSNYNVVVARPLWSGRCDDNDIVYTHYFDRTGMPIIYSDSCLAIATIHDSATTAPAVLMDIEVVSA